MVPQSPALPPAPGSCSSNYGGPAVFTFSSANVLSATKQKSAFNPVSRTSVVDHVTSMSGNAPSQGKINQKKSRYGVSSIYIWLHIDISCRFTNDGIPWRLWFTLHDAIQRFLPSIPSFGSYSRYAVPFLCNNVVIA